MKQKRNVVLYLRIHKIVPKPLCTGLYIVESKIAFNDVMYAFNCGRCSDVHLIAS